MNRVRRTFKFICL